MIRCLHVFLLHFLPVHVKMMVKDWKWNWLGKWSRITSYHWRIKQSSSLLQYPFYLYAWLLKLICHLENWVWIWTRDKWEIICSSFLAVWFWSVNYVRNNSLVGKLSKLIQLISRQFSPVWRFSFVSLCSYFVILELTSANLQSQIGFTISCKLQISTLLDHLLTK